MRSFKRKRLYGLPRTGQVTSYRDGDDGYFERGWPATEAERFIVIGDGTVYDKVTGLYWPVDYATAPGSPFDAKVNWDNAIDNCLALDFAGYTDWRLANILELFSIIDWSISPLLAPNSVVYPVITVQTGIKGEANHFTSTMSASSTTKAMVWDVSIISGLMTLLRTVPAWVLPVRGGR